MMVLVLPAGLVSEVCRGDGCWSYLQAWSVRSVEVNGADLTCRPGQ